MLVLSRKQDSAIHIGSDIKVKVLSIKRQAVTLGVDAPEGVRVWRDELAPQLDPQRPSPSRNDSTTGMKTVLVIEDDPGHAKLICRALRQNPSTKVTVAATAQSALDALGAQVTSPDDVIPPDLILLDLGLPDGSGMDLLRTIRSVPELRMTPVVVFSCSDDEDVVSRCLESGANAFVPKSAGYDDFHAQVVRVGQFWTGDCFGRRTLKRRVEDRPATSQNGAAANDADGYDGHSATTGRPKRILLADDDAGHAALINRALRRAKINCTVDVVHSGVEAIDYLFGLSDAADRQATATIDLMLLDLNMPDMNGLQVLKVLRNARGQRGQRLWIPPIVVLSSSDELTDVHDSYDLGAHSFIRKPVDHGQFAHAVQQTAQYWLGLNESLNAQTPRRTSLPR